MTYNALKPCRGANDFLVHRGKNSQCNSFDVISSYQHGICLNLNNSCISSMQCSKDVVFCGHGARGLIAYRSNVLPEKKSIKTFVFMKKG